MYAVGGASLATPGLCCVVVVQLETIANQNEDAERKEVKRTCCLRFTVTGTLCGRVVGSFDGEERLGCADEKQSRGCWAAF